MSTHLDMDMIHQHHSHILATKREEEKNVQSGSRSPSLSSMTHSTHSISPHHLVHRLGTQQQQHQDEDDDDMHDFDDFDEEFREYDDELPADHLRTDDQDEQQDHDGEEEVDEEGEEEEMNFDEIDEAFDEDNDKNNDRINKLSVQSSASVPSSRPLSPALLLTNNGVRFERGRWVTAVSSTKSPQSNNKSQSMILQACEFPSDIDDIFMDDNSNPHRHLSAPSSISESPFDSNLNSTHHSPSSSSTTNPLNLSGPVGRILHEFEITPELTERFRQTEKLSKQNNPNSFLSKRHTAPTRGSPKGYDDTVRINWLMVLVESYATLHPLPILKSSAKTTIPRTSRHPSSASIIPKVHSNPTSRTTSRISSRTPSVVSSSLFSSTASSIARSVIRRPTTTTTTTNSTSGANTSRIPKSSRSLASSTTASASKSSSSLIAHHRPSQSTSAAFHVNQNPPSSARPPTSVSKLRKCFEPHSPANKSTGKNTTRTSVQSSGNPPASRPPRPSTTSATHRPQSYTRNLDSKRRELERASPS